MAGKCRGISGKYLNYLKMSACSPDSARVADLQLHLPIGSAARLGNAGVTCRGPRDAINMAIAASRNPSDGGMAPQQFQARRCNQSFGVTHRRCRTRRFACAQDGIVAGGHRHARAREAIVPPLNKGGNSGPISGTLPRSGDPSACLTWLVAPLRRAFQPGSATTEESPNQQVEIHLPKSF